MSENPYTYGNLGERWVKGQATRTARLNRTRIKVDNLKVAVDALIGDSDTVGQGFLADWQAPLYSHNTAGTAWLAEWLDNTDTANIVKRMKSGTSQALATPASMTDGVPIAVGIIA